VLVDFGPDREVLVGTLATGAGVALQLERHGITAKVKSPASGVWCLATVSHPGPDRVFSWAESTNRRPVANELQAPAATFSTLSAPDPRPNVG
jgi:hypothetical protein